MKKILTMAFLPLLFCTALFAKDYVVASVRGTVKYETSDGVWEVPKSGDTITGETKVDVGLNSQLEIKDDDGNIHIIGSLKSGAVDELIKKKSIPKPTQKKAQLIEVAIMPDYIDDLHLEVFNYFGFDSIKDLPAGKNVVRLCSTAWMYEIIELTWTNNSASIVFVKGDDDTWVGEGEEIVETEKQRIERKLSKKDVKKIIDIIEKTNFYNQPAYISHPSYSIRDGENWYIEANINGSYKSIEREYPFPDFLKQLGDALYDLAKEK